MKCIALPVVLFLAACATAPAQPQARCLPAAGFSRADLDTLKAAEWQIADDSRRDALARALTACLGDADPTLRDGIAFEAYAHWLRARQLSNETMLWLADDLERRLTAPEGSGFERPFAALVLSEVARADRIEAYMTPERRAQLVNASIAYFTNVRDYRGFDESEGWRHGVAHGADLLLQLGINRAIGRADQERIRDAVATQVAPEGHFYTYGESERLGRVIFFMARRGDFTAEEWTAWLARFADPAPLGAWNEAYLTQAGLARRHNVVAFLNFLATSPRLTWDDEEDDILIAGAEAALRRLR
jgi:hypothetical protein